MGTEAAGPAARKPLPLPPRLLLARARSRATRVASMHDDAAAAAVSTGQDTPPRLSPVTVPFLWEDAPGRPKRPQSPAAAGPPPAPVAPAATGGEADGDAMALKLKLPPRLQRVPSSDTTPLSPKTVLHGPYCSGARTRRPLRRTGSLAAAFRRTPTAGLFSRTAKPATAAAAAAPSTNNKNAGGGHDHLDAPWGSPAASSASSSPPSSVSTFFGDDHPPSHRRPADERDDSEEESEQDARGSSVRITRFRRNRSLPTITTSHLWANIRKSFKQITPWS